MFNKDLFVFHRKSGNTDDLTYDLRDYLRDDVAINFVAADDELLIGLYKPFQSVFAELEASQLEGAKLSFEYSTTTGFSPLEIIDDTRNLNRSGFILWDRQLDDWASETYESRNLYWIKITSDIDFTCTLKGLNLLFSDDNDLVSEIPRIDKYMPKGETSFVKYHVAARNEIIQTLRNGGWAKQDKDNNPNESLIFAPYGEILLKDLTKWDILDIGQIRNASKFLTLAKIFHDNSANVDDKEYQNFVDFTDAHSKAFNLFYMSIDFNDDGKTDGVDEQMHLNDVTVIKI